MSKSSATSTPERRTPQRKHGERRFVALLEAADAVIAERGFEGATMTLIAERAGSSIGTAYQYFADKDALASALGARYSEEMASLWPPLAEHLRTLKVDEFAGTVMQALVSFMADRPAYVHLMAASKHHKRDAKTRFHLRDSFAALLQSIAPKLSVSEAHLVTGIALRIIMSLGQEYGRAKPKEREPLVAEFTLALRAYLKERLANPS